MELKPDSAVVHLYYKCSKCGEKSDDVPLRQAKVGGPLVCWNCNNRDYIKPIKEVQAIFQSPMPQNKYPEYIGFTQSQIRQAKFVLGNAGYKQKEVAELIKKALHASPRPTDLDSLVRTALREARKDDSKRSSA